MATPSEYERKQRRNIAALQARIDRIFRKAAEEAARIGISIRDLPDDRIFSFDDYPKTLKQVERLLDALHSSVQTTVTDGIRLGWALADDKNDALVRRVFGKGADSLTPAQQRIYFARNADALEAFIARKTAGLSLSGRVWRYTNAFRSEIEMGLDIGIRSGLPASQMARELKKYLQYPDKLFRRVRDKHGMLKLSKAAAAFNPGRGVYRSSYMNARRLAATETNIAYRSADYERRQSQPMVVGIEVHLSGNHTCLGRDGKMHELTDICDDLAGKYPKDFKFTGWHPLCRCIATPIMKTDKEMAEENRRFMRGEEPLPSSNSVNCVKEYPPAFKEWVGKNAGRIEAAEQRGKLPYFIADNKRTVDRILGRVPSMTPLEAAAQRHANRTAHQADDIKRRYWMRFEPQHLTPEQKRANIEAYLQIERGLGIKRGLPMSHDQANQLRGNPHYKKAEGYQVNCQTCVVAYELRLRGFDVSALPNTAGSALEKLAGETYAAWQGLKRADIPIFGRSYIGANNKLKRERLNWKKVNAAMSEPGRYHIGWRWKRKWDGHIITIERFPDGTFRSYDPQTGEIGVLRKYSRDIAGSVTVYRVDTLAPNAEVVNKVLTKGEAKAAAGTVSRKSVTGHIDYSTVLPLRKEALASGKFEFGEIKDMPNLLSSKLLPSKSSLKRTLNHCINEEEISALEYIWANPQKLKYKRISPMGEGKDVNNIKDLRNMEKKQSRGVVDYVEYEISISGKLWLVKTERTKRGFEQLYHIRKK